MKHRQAVIGPRVERRRRALELAKAPAPEPHGEPVADPADEALLLREKFLENVAHDLRGPLATITMAAALLAKRGTLDEQQATLLGSITRGSARMLGMIAQLTDFTQAKLGGGLALDPQPCDLGELCRAVAYQLEDRPIPVTCTVQGDVRGVWDSDRLSQSLTDLVENAIAHAAPGSAATMAVTGSDDEVTIAVSNRGEPIATELRAHIFDPFFRAPRQFKSAHLGLGLYVARQVALAHGGDLELCCADGLTTFAMRLPRRPAAVAS